jgi:hypothetical protein
MSKIWNYFTKSANVAYCNVDNCNYTKDFPPQSSTTPLISHLKHNHDVLHKQYLALTKAETTKDKQTQPTIKRTFQEAASTSLITIDDAGTSNKQSKIELCFQAKSKYYYKHKFPI